MIPGTVRFSGLCWDCFIGGKEGHPAGREMILETARQQNVALSQKKIRDILALMAQKGFATVSRGRGGSRITETGQKCGNTNTNDQ